MGPEQTDFWTTLTITEQRVEQGNFNYYMLGKLRDGITPQRASEEFRASAAQIFHDQGVRYPSYRSVL